MATGLIKNTIDLLTQTFESEPKDLPALAAISYTTPVSYTGYRHIGIVGITVTNASVAINENRISGNNVVTYVFNPTNSKISNFKVYPTVLFKKITGGG